MFRGARPCFVVGAGGDIGAAVVRQLAEDGRDLVLTKSSRGELDVDSSVLPDHRGKAWWLQMDVRDSTSVEHAVAEVREHLGSAFDVVYCAGIVRDAPIALCTDEAWASSLAVNLTGAFYVLRAVARDLMVAGESRVVLLGSVSGRLGNPGQASYSAAKAGLEALARTAAVEFGRFGVCINVLAVGAVESAMLRATGPGVVDRLISATPLRRLCSVAQVAQTVSALLGPAGSHLTGQTIVMDGGFSVI